MRTAYVSIDGEIFSNENDCIRHDQNFLGGVVTTKPVIKKIYMKSAEKREYDEDNFLVLKFIGNKVKIVSYPDIFIKYSEHTVPANMVNRVSSEYKVKKVGRVYKAYKEFFNSKLLFDLVSTFVQIEDYDYQIAKDMKYLQLMIEYKKSLAT